MEESKVGWHCPWPRVDDAPHHKFDYDKLAGHEKPSNKPLPLDTALIRLGDTIYDYLLSFSECSHGQRPSTCAMCGTSIGKDPARWGYDPRESLSENSMRFQEYQDELIGKVRRNAARDNSTTMGLRNPQQNINISKRDMRAADPAAYADISESRTVNRFGAMRRPMKVGGPDRTLNDARNYEHAGDVKHREGGELRKYYGANEKTWNKDKRRYEPTPDNKITKVPRGDSYMEYKGKQRNNLGDK